MRTIFTIAFKEYQLAMRSISSYIVYILFLIIGGAAYSTIVFKIGDAGLRSYYEIIHALFVLFIPALTMGSIAREQHSGTMEILFTMPIRLIHIVWGKILAAFFQLLTLLSFTAIFYIVVATMGMNFDHGANLLGFAGMMLAGLCYISIGIFASSLHENQIQAFVIALVISGFFYAIKFVIMLMPLSMVRYLQFFSFDHHLASFLRGVLDLRDLLFFLACSLIFSFLAEFKLQAQNLLQER
ncbi:MAG: ABC transporter permease subunit [Candidatus Cloacimonetes bacterium]|nr:ABC transporter permease subunit [Candidatus Cloacimonadota bacterium]